MSFFAFYKLLSPMTLRQRLRYLFLVYKKIRQTHRQPNETETVKPFYARALFACYLVTVTYCMGGFDH